MPCSAPRLGYSVIDDAVMLMARVAGIALDTTVMAFLALLHQHLSGYGHVRHEGYHLLFD